VAVRASQALPRRQMAQTRPLFQSAYASRQRAVDVAVGLLQRQMRSIRHSNGLKGLKKCGWCCYENEYALYPEGKVRVVSRRQKPTHCFWVSCGIERIFRKQLCRVADTIHIVDRGAFRWRMVLLWALRGVFAVLIGLATLSVLRSQAAGAPFHDHIVIFVLLAIGAIATESVLRHAVRTSQILAWVNLRLRAAERLIDAPGDDTARAALHVLSPVAAIGTVTTLLGAGFITLVLLIGMASMSRLALFIQVVFLVLSAVAMLLSRYAPDPLRPWYEVARPRFCCLRLSCKSMPCRCWRAGCLHNLALMLC